MKQLILDVLSRFKSTQTNLESIAARELLATEIEKALVQNEQIRKIERELYRGEG